MTNAPVRSELINLYAESGGVTKVFSAKVADYIVARPDYPSSLIEWLRESGGLNERATVADVAAGTGLLTRDLLSYAGKVIAVEPNVEMLAACDAFLGRHARYAGLVGTAERTSLDIESIDLITVATAFHWCEPHATRREFLRILKPGGKVALVWNDRVLSDHLHVGLDQIFLRYGGARRDAIVATAEQRNTSAFFNGAAFDEKRFEHTHFVSRDSIIALAFSRSYMPSRTGLDGLDAIRDIENLMASLAINDVVPVRYETVAYLGRPRDAA